MHESLDKFITILEKIISGNSDLSLIESDLLNISNSFKTNQSEINKEDFDLINKINKIEKLISEIEKKFEKKSTL